MGWGGGGQQSGVQAGGVAAGRGGRVEGRKQDRDRGRGAWCVRGVGIQVGGKLQEAGQMAGAARRGRAGDEDARQSMAQQQRLAQVGAPTA